MIDTLSVNRLVDDTSMGSVVAFACDGVGRARARVSVASETSRKVGRKSIALWQES